MRPLQLIASALLVLTFAAGLVSCGGTGLPSTRGTGRLAVSVRWPATRDIPPATRSLAITATTLRKNEVGAKVEDVVVATKVVTRPEGGTSTTTVLEPVPSVEVRVKVQAFASADGTGSPLAAGQTDVTIEEDGTTSANITLHGPSTAGQVLVDPSTSLVGICLQGRRFYATVTGLSDKRVVWSLSGGGVITKQVPPDEFGTQGYVEIEPGRSTGTFTVKATSAADPTKFGTAQMIVDIAVGSSWNGGSLIFGDPDADGKYVVVDRDRARSWLVTRTGNTFSGPQTLGGTGSLTCTISGDTLAGNLTQVQERIPLSYARDIFCEAQ